MTAAVAAAAAALQQQLLVLAITRYAIQLSYLKAIAAHPSTERPVPLNYFCRGCGVSACVVTIEQ
eukprot:14050-Heterococcus_DN1.PRE.1